ncbi:hypothetical protein CCYA_CCYA09G2656 [Cyanidiococcus yangmingshanensis]|nr:hypothetical protein CCYA_CCYA09G2656 [Cyanidiococcus yangmingshanensis]
MKASSRQSASLLCQSRGYLTLFVSPRVRLSCFQDVGIFVARTPSSPFLPSDAQALSFRRKSRSWLALDQTRRRNRFSLCIWPFLDLERNAPKFCLPYPILESAALKVSTESIPVKRCKTRLETGIIRLLHGRRDQLGCQRTMVGDAQSAAVRVPSRRWRSLFSLSLEKTSQSNSLVNEKMGSVERSAVLGLYRQMLRAAQHYPSVRKRAVYEAIREEFRLNRDLKPADATEKLRLGVYELERLSIFRSTRNPKDLTKPNNSPEWSIQL